MLIHFKFIKGVPLKIKHFILCNIFKFTIFPGSMKSLEKTLSFTKISDPWKRGLLHLKLSVAHVYGYNINILLIYRSFGRVYTIFWKSQCIRLWRCLLDFQELGRPRVKYKSTRAYSRMVRHTFIGIEIDKK